MEESQAHRYFDYCLQVADSLPYAKAYYREDWKMFYFSLDGKMFGLLMPKGNHALQVSLKGKPEENEMLRETFQAVTPGYHLNKTHWNSIDLASQEVTEQMLKKLIEASYRLVFQKLTKKRQAELQKCRVE